MNLSVVLLTNIKSFEFVPISLVWKGLWCIMIIKELKEYLNNFQDNDTATLSAWFCDGQKYFLPHKPCCDPIIKTVDGKRYAVIGHFDNCLAHQIIIKKGREG